MIARGQHFLRRKFVRDTLILQIGKVGVTTLSTLSSVLVFRLLGPETFGIWALAQSFFAISQAFDFTGVELSTGTRLAAAIGAENDSEILNLLGFYIKISTLWALTTLILMAVIAPLTASLIYGGNARIGILAVWLSLSVLTDALYNLFVITLQSCRLMRALALLQNLNQLTLALCIVVALVTNATPEGMVAARLAYSGLTMIIAFIFYQRFRTQGSRIFPPFLRVIVHARAVPIGPYWRFGVLNALDKNVANLYSEIPLQLVGIFGGHAAAGYLELGFKAMTLPGMFTSAVFDNLQAVVPQAVGRRDFARLWHNFTRILLTLTGAAIGFYVVFALAMPIIVPLLYGAKAISAVPVIVVLSVYGAITTVGGIFGPLYRALYLLRAAIIIKVGALILMLVPGLFLVQTLGASGGAWMVNLLYALTVILTAGVTLPVLRGKALEKQHVEFA
jgi:O-antigen/teichoic acid export membrane protein